LDILWKRTC